LWLCVLFFRLLLCAAVAANARARGRNVYPRAWAFSACSRFFFIASAVEAFRLRVAYVIFALLVSTNSWQFGLFIFSVSQNEK